eukprot:evm.model.NODE_49791_length_6007_cov_17.182787.1
MGLEKGAEVAPDMQDLFFVPAFTTFENAESSSGGVGRGGGREGGRGGFSLQFLEAQAFALGGRHVPIVVVVAHGCNLFYFGL